MEKSVRGLISPLKRFLVLRRTWLRIEMNTVKKAENKGREQGMQEGEKKGRLEIAKTMLRQQFSMKQVVEITGLSEEDVKHL